MKFFKTIIIFALISIAFSWNTKDANQPIENEVPPFYHYVESPWVDSVLASMSIEEKIGQLFMVAAYSNKDERHFSKIDKLIKEQHIGGLIFFQGGAGREIDLTNRYQAQSKFPLLIAGDWEWGLSMRLDSTVMFPRQMMLGAIQDDSLIYNMGTEIARQIKRIGGHVNFAPVVDINNNPKNPVIGSRSFGEDRERVYSHALQYMKGLQDHKILAVAKHFPGHGDTDVDSHKALPIISHNKARLDSIELYPFRKLFKKGMGGVMVAHLFVPVLDSTANTATTLSHKVSTELLKEEMGFKGLAFTDALNMKGVSKYYDPGIADLKALLAGNDVLLFPKDVPNAIARIKTALAKKQLNIAELELHVRKILAVKYWAGAHEFEPISKENIHKDLNNEDVWLMQQTLVEKALTVVRNENNILPLKALDTLNIASVSIGDFSTNKFQRTLKLYSQVDDFQMKKFPTDEEFNTLKKKLSNYNLVIFSFNKTNRSPRKNYGISRKSIALLEGYAKEKAVIVDVFANPYVLKKFKSIDHFKAIIVSYNNWTITQKSSAQLIFGGIPALGKLPVGINSTYPLGHGESYGTGTRLKYTYPKDAGIDESKLYKIDSIVINSIREGAFPGCQVLAARNGKVFYNKSFGYCTYDKKQGVTNGHLYDLASMTKILATTASLMKMQDENIFDVNQTLGYYLPEIDTTNKADLVIKNVLLHQARLKPWIPFYLKTIDSDSIKSAVYHATPSGAWTVPVADSMFISKTYKDTIFKEILNSDLRKKNEYKYSDLGYYLIQRIIEKETQTPLDKYAEQSFYKSLGANHLSYTPLNKFSENDIVPTEDDHYFRNQLVRGYVHDMGSAMMGGVGGHAGLFSNANDVAKMMQMFLNKGKYAGRQYLSEDVVEQYTSCQNCPTNRRGLGFDKRQMDTNKIGPTCDLVSAKSFGHTGFTGTMAWGDPETGILYVFLSNRINPSSENIKLIKLHTRTHIQEVLNEAIL